ncbi:angiopoietin-related protein 3 precursor-like [Scleropages formosus]|uniref:Angiopoietin-related protein 3-like n=1 Tax=Scleropages formosus TaxID=113540 RepID=A0A0P7V971_SCLFO|nr:angiopoietin-related protein 3 precursor-like [Scleropages formosus]
MEKSSSRLEEDLVLPQIPEEANSRFAMLEDVRLLANGLLQLGHSLKEFAHKTKGQINDIFQKLSFFNKSFYQLSAVASEIREEKETLRKTTDVLKANNEEVLSLSHKMSSRMSGLLQDRSQLQRKVVELEEKLSSLSHNQLPEEQMAELTALKDVIDAQEKSIIDLLKAMKEQHEQLNHQKIKLKILEEKVEHLKFSVVPKHDEDNVQETSKRSVSFNTETLGVMEYLLNNSTSANFDTNDLAKDCQEVFRRGVRVSGVYPIKPNESLPFNVYCEMAAEGGSTVIQRRNDGSVDFDQTWEKYENGFGDFNRDFWLGLQKILAITRQGDYILRIELDDWKLGRRFADYRFTLGGPTSHYTLHLEHMAGDLPDAMNNNTNMGFSTKDQDHDNNGDGNCAQNYSGGWWFNACGNSNLNGKYTHGRQRGRSERRKGIYWKPSAKGSFSPRSTKMSLRPASSVRGPH